MINIAVLDDEEKTLQEIGAYLESFNKEYGKEIKADFYSSAVTFLEKTDVKYDIIFLDIEMPYRNGMQVAESIRTRDERVIIVFVTNMAQYAIKGYEVQAYGFLVKPINYLKISTLLCRAIKRVESMKEEDSIVVKSSAGNQVLAVADISYVEISGHKLVYHVGGGSVTAWGTLKTVEQELSQYDFVKCNNCYLVNLRYVTAVEDFTLKLRGEKLPISQSKKKAFMDKLTEYLSR